MKTILVAVLLFCGAGLFADDIPRVHKFQLWGGMKTSDKQLFMMGFTNGLITGASAPRCNDNGTARALLKCVLDPEKADFWQDIAMIDKYYKENPARWSEPIGDAILEALTVNGSPCAWTADPKK
jgi:hypothetical protein